MPRHARENSSSGIYHVMLRGINKQQIFEDKEDCEKFIRVLNEPVETDSYLVAVMRYIHNNPVKAGITKTPDYPYSSYHEYLAEQSDLVDTDIIFSYMDKKAFQEYHQEQDENQFLDIEDHKVSARLTDEQAKKLVAKITHCNSTAAFQSLTPAKRDHYIVKLKNSGLSIRQISRLTGASYYLIQKL